MAAYLAAAVVSTEDRRLPPAITAALDRLRACVRAKMGADPATRLLNHLAGTDTLEAVGSAFNVAVSVDHEFARQLGVIFDELEASGAHYLVDEARAHYRGNETARPDADELSGLAVICEACGGSNRSGAGFCAFCGSFLAWDSPGPEPDSLASRPPVLTEPSPPTSPEPELQGRAGLVCPNCGFALADPRWAACPRCHHPLTFDDDLLPNSPGSLASPGDTQVVQAYRPPDSSSAEPLQTVVDRAVSRAVTEGRVLFNPPERMRQGIVERVEVAIARTKDLDHVLRQIVRGRGQARIEDVETSPFMAVELKGPGFDITPLRAATSEQLLRPTALWEFDVLPKKSGEQTLQVCVDMRIPIPDRLDERVSIPVLERHVHVVIDARYGSQQFLKRNWQWLIATLAGLGGALAAWLKLFGGGD